MDLHVTGPVQFSVRDSVCFEEEWVVEDNKEENH